MNVVCKYVRKYAAQLKVRVAQKICDYCNNDADEKTLPAAPRASGEKAAQDAYSAPDTQPHPDDEVLADVLVAELGAFNGYDVGFLEVLYVYGVEYAELW